MTNSAKFMFTFSVITFFVISISASHLKLPFNCNDCESALFLSWVFRLISALAASAISISLPGMLEIKFNKMKDGRMQTLKDEATGEEQFSSLADKEPTITASGAIAVFVLVYLFNPIG